jgi:hypothetical protein
MLQCTGIGNSSLACMLHIHMLALQKYKFYGLEVHAKPQKLGNAESAKEKSATGAGKEAAVRIYEIRCMIYNVRFEKVLSCRIMEAGRTGQYFGSKLAPNENMPK